METFTVEAVVLKTDGLTAGLISTDLEKLKAVEQRGVNVSDIARDVVNKEK